MKKYSKNIPEGTRDIIFKNAEIVNRITADINKVYEELNYREVKTPTIEYYDVFDFESQPVLQESMYKLTDNNGRLVVLRPDNTTPMARLVSSKLRNEKQPIKIYYNQNVYRINADYSGKKNEYLQSGIEIIGGDRLKSDIFYIETALKVLQSLGMNYKLEIGHAAFYNSIIKKLNLSKEVEEQIRVFIESKNINDMDLSFESKIDEDIYKILKKIPQLFGGNEVIEEAKKLINGNEEALEVLNYISTLYNVFCSAGYKDNIMVDIGIVHQLDYYSGCVISGYIDGIGENILTGGRYDTLMQNFDFDVPATGFAINIDKIAEAKLKVKEMCIKGENRKVLDCIIFYDIESFEEVKKYIIEHKEERCEISCFDSMESTVDYAKECGIPKVVYLGKNNKMDIKVSND